MNPYENQHIVRALAKPRGLYKSEEWFFDKVISDSESVLEVGCGTRAIVQSYMIGHGRIPYTGVDSSEAMIAEMRQNDHYGPEKYHVADATDLPFEMNSFDSSIAFGVIHQIPEWRTALREMYRVARKYCLFDVRLSSNTALDEETCKQHIVHKDYGTVPYIVVNIAYFFDSLKSLKPTPQIEFYGYNHKLADTVSGVTTDAFMTAILLKKPEL